MARTPLEGGASSTEPESRERAAAALGYVAAAVDLIARYLGVRLLYSISTPWHSYALPCLIVRHLGPMAALQALRLILACASSHPVQVALRYPMVPKASRSHVLDKRYPLELSDSAGHGGNGSAPGGGSASRSASWGSSSGAQSQDGGVRALPLFLDGCAVRDSISIMECFDEVIETETRSAQCFHSQGTRQDAICVRCLSPKQKYRANSECIR